MRRTMNLLMAVAVAAAMLVGCSSGGGGSSRSSKEISKADYIKQGNALCQKFNKKLDAASKGVDPSNKAQYDKFLRDKAVPEAENLIKQLKGLGTPKGDDAKLDKLYGSMQSDLDKVKKNPSSDGPSKTEDLLKGYGLTDCTS